MDAKLENYMEPFANQSEKRPSCKKARSLSGLCFTSILPMRLRISPCEGKNGRSVSSRP